MISPLCGESQSVKKVATSHFFDRLRAAAKGRSFSVRSGKIMQFACLQVMTSSGRKDPCRHTDIPDTGPRQGFRRR